MDIGLGILVLAGIFLLYRVGAISIAQTGSKKIVRTMEVSLQVYEAKVVEKATKEFGKIAVSLADEGIPRSDYKTVMSSMKNIGQKTEVVAE